MKMTTYQMMKKANDRVVHDIRIVNAAIKTSTRTYIPSDKIGHLVREILQFITTRYHRSTHEITKQMFQHYQTLKTAFIKTKIEFWIIK